MSDLKRVGNIEIEQDLRFQRGEWRFQRIGRIVLALIALVALMGGFGKGPLARAVRRAPSITVEYERIARHRADTTLDITLANSSGPVTLTLNRAYLDGAVLKHILPEPSSMKAAPDHVEFTFDALPLAHVQLVLEPGRLLTRVIELGLAGGPTLRMSQFVLP